MMINASCVWSRKSFTIEIQNRLHPYLKLCGSVWLASFYARNHTLPHVRCGEPYLFSSKRFVSLKSIFRWAKQSNIVDPFYSFFNVWLSQPCDFFLSSFCSLLLSLSFLAYIHPSYLEKFKCKHQIPFSFNINYFLCLFIADQRKMTE